MNAGVIIPTRSRPEQLRRTLDSLAAQSHADFEVVVVCDGEDQETRRLGEEYQAAFPLRWIWLRENRGQANARNEGARDATDADILVFLDDDALPASGWLAAHCRHHEPDRPMAVRGPIIDRYAQPAASHTEDFLRSMHDQICRATEKEPEADSEVRPWACFGFNCSIGRTLFLHIGGFDPQLPSLAEDFELGERLYQMGVEFRFEPQAIVHHQDTKNLVDYSLWIAEEIGRADIYRVRTKGQRNRQTERLIRIHRGPLLKRTYHRIAWYAPRFFEKAQRLTRRITDSSKSGFSFRQWQRLSAARYWAAVRSGGETLASLEQLSGAPLPCLMFHSVSDLADSRMAPWTIAPKRLRRFLRWLRDSGYRSISTRGWNGSTAGKRVLLTFDDGYENFYTTAFPLLQEFGMTATVFLVVGALGKTNEWDACRGAQVRQLLSVKQARELTRFGITFGCHTLTHSSLAGAAENQLRREVDGAKAALQDLLGSEIIDFAYPYGQHDARARRAVAAAGFRFAFGCEEGLNFWNDPFSMKRTTVSQGDSVLEFALKVQTGRSLRGVARGFLPRG